MPTIVRFDEIEAKVPPKKPGIYEIHTDTGIALKVGIGGNIRERLLQHRDSLQRALKPKVIGQWDSPANVVSKRSILAKHLYYDRSITSDFHLKSEEGRRAFLRDKCFIKFEVTQTREEARELERRWEKTGEFRYAGKVSLR